MKVHMRKLCLITIKIKSEHPEGKYTSIFTIQTWGKMQYVHSEITQSIPKKYLVRK